MAHTYLRSPGLAGTQPLHRSAVGGNRLKFHALGCAVDGGHGLPRGACEKCRDSAAEEYYRTLLRIDKRVRAA